jgi:hypothetical protein
LPRRIVLSSARHRRHRGGPMLVDLPLSELRGYVPEVAEPADFDE